MSKLLTFVSATFVLIFAATSATASPQHEVPESRTTEPEPPTRPPDDNLIISRPQPRNEPPPPLESRYYSARQALTVRAGVASDPVTKRLASKVLGFQYIFPKFLPPKIEAGADLHEHGRGHLHLGARWYWGEKDYFRPSVKAAVDHLMVGSEGLGTLVKIENFYLRAGAALEYVVTNPYSLRLEGEIAASTKEFPIIVTLGLSRGW